VSSGKYIQLVNETRAAEKKLKMSELGDDDGRGGGKVSKYLYFSFSIQTNT